MAPDKPAILIVDDSAANIQVLNVILQADYNIFFAESGPKALKTVKETDIDLILLDIMMPGMDGYEVCARLKADAAVRDIPVIFVTALSDDDDESRGFACGAVDYIPKPFRMPTVRARIKTHLELRRHRTSLERLVAERTEELMAAYERLKVLERTKSDLLTSVSHELRTPLTSLLGFSQMSVKKLRSTVLPALTALPGDHAMAAARQVEDNLLVILDEGRRLTQLVDNVMDLMQLVSETLRLVNKPVSLKEVAQRALEKIGDRFARKGLTLETDLADGPLVLGDKDRLIQVAINLLDNALKFTENGSVFCGVGQENGQAVLTVRDTGVGISQEHQEVIYEKFSQLGDVLTQKPAGLGIGLTISRKIIELHGGELRLTSRPGQGSAFSVLLPPCD